MWVLHVGRVDVLGLVLMGGFLLQGRHLVFAVVCRRCLCSMDSCCLFLLVVLLSCLPISVSVCLAGESALLSSFELFREDSTGSSVSSKVTADFNSPSGLKDKFPSRLWM